MASANRKARRAMQRKLAALDGKTREVTQGMLDAQAKQLEADANALNEKAKANELLVIAKEKLKEDMQVAYDKRLMEMKTQMETEANQQIKHYSREVERKLKKAYRAKETELRSEVKNLLLGEFVSMTALVLHDYFDIDADGMKKYVLELMRLANNLEYDRQFNEDVDEEDQLTLANIIAKLDEEDFHLTECLEEVDRKMEMEKAYLSFPYVFPHKGWTTEDDGILQGMIEKDFDYLTIAKKLQKTEGAVKSRAFKLWDTSIKENIRRKLKEKAVA